VNRGFSASVKRGRLAAGAGEACAGAAIELSRSLDSADAPGSSEQLAQANVAKTPDNIENFHVVSKRMWVLPLESTLRDGANGFAKLV
jgi:hypothetical protein